MDPNQREWVDSFLGEVDDLYEEISEALEGLDPQDPEAALDAVFRPLHTLKGTASFIPGFEEVSHMAHQIEDFVSRLRSSANAAQESDLDLLNRAVEHVFSMVEAVRDDERVSPEQTQRLSAELTGEPTSSLVPGEREQTVSKGNQARLELPQHRDFEATQLGDLVVLEPRTKRINSFEHYEFLNQLFKTLPQGTQVAMNMGDVRSIGSQGWGLIWSHAKSKRLTLIGMSKESACGKSFYAFGLQKQIKLCSGIEDLIGAHHG